KELKDGRAFVPRESISVSKLVVRIRIEFAVGEVGSGCVTSIIDFMQKITVLLADDHAVVRQGLRALLAAEEDMEVVGEAENGRQAVTLAKQTSPDVVVMDVAMPLLNGLEATRQILKQAPAAKVLVLSSYGDDDCV